MTKEEAAKILDPEELQDRLNVYRYYGGFNGEKSVIAAYKQACILAVKALREQPAKLDRSRWEGCEYCLSDLDGYSVSFKDANGRSRNLFIPEGKPEICIFYDRNTYYIPINYCPICGRPLTEEALENLEQRIGENDGKTDR